LKNLTASGFEKRQRAAKLAGAAQTGVMHRRINRMAIEAGDVRQRIRAIGERHACKAGNAPPGGLIERARAAASCSDSPSPWRRANCPVPRICSASDRRAVDCGSAMRTKSRAGPPQGETNRHQRKDDCGGAVPPRQCQQRWMIVLGQEVHLVCRTQPGRSHEQPAVIAGEELGELERRTVDDRDRPASDCNTHDLDARVVAQLPPAVCGCS
jgi:hypothetical protein